MAAAAGEPPPTSIRAPFPSTTVLVSLNVDEGRLEGCNCLQCCVEISNTHTAPCTDEATPPANDNSPPVRIDPASSRGTEGEEDLTCTHVNEERLILHTSDTLIPPPIIPPIMYNVSPFKPDTASLRDTGAVPEVVI